MDWAATLAAIVALCSPPPCTAGDLDRFPRPVHYWHDDGDGCSHRENFASHTRMEWLRAKRAMHLRDWIEWDEQIAEQEELDEVWAHLDSAWRNREEYHCSPVYELEWLRARIGERNYLSGTMPPPIPLHRYASPP